MWEALITLVTNEYGPLTGRSLEILIDTSYIWLPLILLVSFWKAWLSYVRAKHIYERGSVLLEIRLPREVTKTPRAMELVLNTLYQKGEPESFRHAFWEGKLPPWISLELISQGGFVHFYVWSTRKLKNVIEKQFYAQYPNIEVYEVEDYAKNFQPDLDRYSLWGCQFKLAKKDVYPISTYVDYGLDKAQKEEEKVDPLTSLLEYLGGLEPGHTVWIQILLKAHRKEGVKDARLFPRPDWTEEARKEITSIRDEYAINKAEGKYLPLVESDTDTIKAIRRAMNKFPFNAVIRAVYFAERETFDSSNISGLLGTFQQYNSNTLNGFKLSWKTDFDHPWKDFRGLRARQKQLKLVDAYKRRSFFYPPYQNFQQKPFILSTEEVATIFHIPGAEALTPTLPRVGSHKGEAPANLPTE